MVRIAFILFTNLSVGAGTENTIIEYCKNAPPQFDITIVQTDNPRGQMKCDKKCFGGRDVKLITIKGYDHKFSFISRNIVGKILYLFLIQPVLFRMLGLTAYRGIQKQIGHQDIIYVVQNHFSSLFKKGPIIIGNTQCWNPIQSGIKSIFTKFVEQGIFWHRIDYFQVFHHYSFILSRKKGFVLDSGVDTSTFNILNKDRSKKNFVFWGRLEECKGVKVVVEAFKALSSKYVRLNIIGQGSLYESTRNDDNIEYFGYLSHGEITNVLNESGCLVYPSTCDTFSLVVIEALASGLYVIASTYLRGIFDEFQNLGVLEYCDPTPHALSERMKNFLSKDIDILAFDRAYQLIKEKYSWYSISNSLYDHLLNFIVTGRNDNAKS